jgi:hypothetical protein
MRDKVVRFGSALGSLIGALLVLAAPVAAVDGDTVADAVLGQPDFTSAGCNGGFPAQC